MSLFNRIKKNVGVKTKRRKNEISRCGGSLLIIKAQIAVQNSNTKGKQSQVV
jgi:hypothetical protein